MGPFFPVPGQEGLLNTKSVTAKQGELASWQHRNSMPLLWAAPQLAHPCLARLSLLGTQSYTLPISGRKILFLFSPVKWCCTSPCTLCDRCKNELQRFANFRGSQQSQDAIPMVKCHKEIYICEPGFYQNYKLRFFTRPTQLILLQHGKRHTSCLHKFTISLNLQLCMKTSRLLPKCTVLILIQNCLVSICNIITNPRIKFSHIHILLSVTAEKSDSLSVMNTRFSNICISPSLYVNAALLRLHETFPSKNNNCIV